MKLNNILISGRPGQKTGFKAQGGSLFTRFCRYSYPENSTFDKAFSSGKAKLLNEVDVYPQGIIIVRNFNWSGTCFIVEGVEPQMAGKRIKKQDFENFIDNLEKMSSERAKKRNDLHVMAQNNKIIIIDNEFLQIFRNYIETTGKETLDSPAFFASFWDYLNGEYKKEAALIRKLLRNKDSREILKAGDYDKFFSLCH